MQLQRFATRPGSVVDYGDGDGSSTTFGMHAFIIQKKRHRQSRKSEMKNRCVRVTVANANAAFFADLNNSKSVQPKLYSTRAFMYPEISPQTSGV